MVYTKEQTKNLAKIMDVGEEIIPLLSYVRPEGQVLNGMGRHLPEVLAELNLQKEMTVLDMPCGQGGVSIPLAQKYGVKVIGYDIIPDYIKYARELAEQRGVSHLCKFEVSDIKDIVKQQDICDVLLWVAPPHLFGKAKPTIEALRNTVKNNGLVVVSDSYLLPEVKSEGGLKDYEPLENANRGYIAFGDEIVKFKDYGNTLWADDYIYTRKIYNEALSKMEKEEDRKKFQELISSLDEKEKREKETLGSAIWVIKIKKYAAS